MNGISKLRDDCELAKLSDESLLATYREQADPAVFEALVNRYLQPVFKYLLRYLRDRALAEDVLQVTLIKVHQKCGQFAAHRKVRPWIYGIATHQAVDALRRRHRQTAVSLERPRGDRDGEGTTNLRELLEATGPSPLEAAMAAEQAEWTRHAVDLLPDHQRLAVLLVFFEGLRYREVAEILQIPEGTVKSRVHKALHAMQQTWNREHRNPRERPE